MLEEYYRKILFMLHLIVETGRKKCRFVVLSFLIEKKKKDSGVPEGYKVTHKFYVLTAKFQQNSVILQEGQTWVELHIPEQAVFACPKKQRSSRAYFAFAPFLPILVPVTNV